MSGKGYSYNGSGTNSQVSINSQLVDGSAHSMPEKREC
jgi:hypothetical protein